MKKHLILVAMICLYYSIACTSLNAQKWVKFQGISASGGSLQLAGILTTPKGNGPFPAVVMLCGCAGLNNRDDKILQQSWAGHFADWGYVSLQVDSFGPRGYKDGVCEGGDEVNNRLRTKDAFAGKRYLESLKIVNKDRIAVAGWSHGGWALMTTIDASYRGEGDRPFQAAIAFYPWCVSSYKRDTPLLVLIGEKDSIFSARDCLNRIDKTLNDTKYEQKVIVYPNATHAFDIEKFTKDYGSPMRHDPDATKDAINQVKLFLEKYLKVQ
jgi:dienelactone hydrolase